MRERRKEEGLGRAEGRQWRVCRGADIGAVGWLFFSNMAEGRLQILMLSRINFSFIARGSVLLPRKQYVSS